MLDVILKQTTFNSLFCLAFFKNCSGNYVSAAKQFLYLLIKCGMQNFLVALNLLFYGKKIGIFDCRGPNSAVKSFY